MRTIPFSEGKSPLVLVDLIHSTRVKDVVQSEYCTAKKADTLYDIQVLMKEHHVGGVLITDKTGKRLLGILTVANIMRAFEEGSLSMPKCRFRLLSKCSINIRSICCLFSTTKN